MKIYSASLEELKEKRNQLDEEKAQRKSRNNAETAMYKGTIKGIENSLKEQLYSGLSQFSTLDFKFNIYINSYEDIEVIIICNENRLFSDDIALSWEYRVELNAYDGERCLKKSSSSYSGLNATTPEQLESLRESYEALVYLNNLNWDDVLNIAIPNWDDIVDWDNQKRISDINSEIYNTDQELIKAKLDEAADTPELIKLSPNAKSEMGINPLSYPYIALRSDTDKFYKYTLITNSMSEKFNNGNEDLETYLDTNADWARIKKVRVIDSVRI